MGAEDGGWGEPKGLGPVRKGCLEEAVWPRPWDREDVIVSKGRPEERLAGWAKHGLLEDQRSRCVRQVEVLVGLAAEQVRGVLGRGDVWQGG